MSGPTTVGTPANQCFFSGTVPLAVGVLNPANSPNNAWDVGTAYQYASITTVVAGTPTSFTIVLEGSLDGVNWSTLATTTNVAGETQFATGAIPFGALRARCSAASGGTSPTVTIVAVAYQNTPETVVGGTTPGGGAVSQGSANTLANAWPVKITDGNNLAAVSFNSGTGASQLFVTTGGMTAGTSLTTATAISNGTALDFGSAARCITCVFTSSGTTSGGTVNLQVSNDNAFWINVGAALNASTFAASGAATLTTNTITATPVAFRYARAVIVSTITGGGTVSATIQDS